MDSTLHYIVAGKKETRCRGQEVRRKEKKREGRREGERRVAMTFNHCTIADICRSVCGVCVV